MMESLHALDLSIFRFFYGLAGRSAAMDGFIIFLARYYFYLILAMLVVALVTSYKNDMRRFWEYVVAIVSGIIARLVVANLIMWFHPRVRPFASLGVPHLLTVTISSFPSGHTIFMFALAMGIWFRNRVFGYFLFASGLIIGLARVAAGVHYPSDILGGMILGVLTTLVLRALVNRFLTTKPA